MKLEISRSATMVVVLPAMACCAFFVPTVSDALLVGAVFLTWVELRR